eukprot:576054-Rhodomonas_salina.1
MDSRTIPIPCRCRGGSCARDKRLDFYVPLQPGRSVKADAKPDAASRWRRPSGAPAAAQADELPRCETRKEHPPVQAAQASGWQCLLRGHQLARSRALNLKWRRLGSRLRHSHGVTRTWQVRVGDVDQSGRG